jgi:hypothetical protein
VNRLATFADPKTRYRDIRYGLAVGLGMRGRPDGIPLLITLARSDPISVIRREARQSLRAIQERALVAGEPVPRIDVGPDAPFETWYPPRGLDWSGPVVVRAAVAEPPVDENKENLTHLVSVGLAPENYRDLNNSNNQAPGAKQMMIRGVRSFEQAVALLSRQGHDSAGTLLNRMVDSPYPFAHYLALREYAVCDVDDVDRLLIAQLDRFAGSSDTVRFYWACEALGTRGVQAAVPQLARLATAENRAGLHGPLGMGLGYPAAKAIARIAGRIDDEHVQRLLAGENIWLRSGALAGLTEARAPGIEMLLEQVLQEHPPGVVYDHAWVGLAQLRGRPRHFGEAKLQPKRSRAKAQRRKEEREYGVASRPG